MKNYDLFSLANESIWKEFRPANSLGGKCKVT